MVSTRRHLAASGIVVANPAVLSSPKGMRSACSPRRTSRTPPKSKSKALPKTSPPNSAKAKSCSPRSQVHRTPEGRGVKIRTRKRSARLLAREASDGLVGLDMSEGRVEVVWDVTTPSNEVKNSFTRPHGPIMKKAPLGVLKKGSTGESSRRNFLGSIHGDPAHSKRFSARLVPSKRRKVGFASVEIREMHVAIGESSVAMDGGPPIGISPRLKRCFIHDVDSFEAERLTGRRSADSVGSPLQPRISQERYKFEGRLPAEERRELLVRAAAAREYIAQAEAESQEIQRHREHTNMYDSYLSTSLDHSPMDYPCTHVVDSEVNQIKHTFYGVADLY